ncbi:MAG: hypothetical protein WCE90_03285 [Candidatus Zixiibacteriota bacterium]
MEIIRLGDRIETRQDRDKEREPYREAEYLAQRVFNPLSDQRQVSSWYIQSSPQSSQTSFFDEFQREIPGLGVFEAKFVQKLLSPERPVICLEGPIGCGKTTVKNYVALNLVAARPHNCTKCGASHKRLVAQIDFSQHTSLNQYSEPEIGQKLAELVCNELEARLRLNSAISREEEFKKFWPKEIDRYRKGELPSKAFRKIITLGEDVEFLDSPYLSIEEMKKRDGYLKLIKSDPELYLDYLVRLWQYAIGTHYNGKRGCAFILLDNIDHVAPIVQRKLLLFVLGSAMIDGPTFVLFVRPETSARVGLATNIVDKIPHKGPSVADVVLDRLRRFCEDPSSFFDPNASLKQEQFLVITEFLKRFQREVSQDPYLVFQTSLSQLCGESIRLGLLTAQRLFSVCAIDMKDPETSINDVIRSCLRDGERQLRWSSSSVVEHTFRVSIDGRSFTLVKPRILRFMSRQPESPKRLNEIYNILIEFEYDSTLIRNALNDLMQLNRQLIRSDGFDFYYENNVLDNYGGHTVILTAIGKAYSEHLLQNIDYIQEVMLDTYVHGDQYPTSIEYGYLREKFKLLRKFLDQLRLIDIYETKNFIKKMSVPGYFENFGKHLVSLDIIKGIYYSAIRILKATEQRRPSRLEGYQEVTVEFESLLLKVEADNNDLLGVYPVH